MTDNKAALDAFNSIIAIQIPKSDELGQYAVSLVRQALDRIEAVETVTLNLTIQIPEELLFNLRAARDAKLEEDVRMFVGKCLEIIGEKRTKI